MAPLASYHPETAQVSTPQRTTVKARDDRWGQDRIDIGPEPSGLSRSVSTLVSNLPAKPLRMMHVIPWPVYGGPHNEALAVAAEGSRRGWTVVAVLPLEADSAAVRLEEVGICVIRMPLCRLRRTLNLAF